MAGVRKRGQRWYAIYKDARGVQVERALPKAVRTKTQAKLDAEELERLGFRVREGLEVAPSKEPLREVAPRYLRTVRNHRSIVAIESRWRLHILPTLGDRPMGHVKSTEVQALLEAKKDEGYSQQTRRHLRVTLAAFFEWAIQERLVKENPVKHTEPIAVPDGDPKVLDLPVVEQVRDAAHTAVMRDLIWVAALTTRRFGELRELRWDMVDLASRSYRYLKGKSGKLGEKKKVAEAPIPAALVPWLERMWAERRGEFLFTTEDGEQLPATFQPAKGFKSALRAAGVVAGWERVCRRKGCGFRERVPEKRSGNCPKCTFALWPRPIASNVAFKDLRSTAVTHIVEATGDLRVAQAVAGHASPSTTGRHYAAKRMQHLLAQVDRAFASVLPVPAGEPMPTDAKGSKGGR